MGKTSTPPPATTSASVHLDALRGAAALLVFTNHTRALYFASPLPHQAVALQPAVQAAAETSAGEGGGTIRIASAAVIVFFVLSGYLVGGSVLRSLRSDRWSWTSYLTKRLVRLFIVLVPALLLGAILDRVGMRMFGPGSIYTAPPGLHLTVSADLPQRLRPLVLLGNLAFLQNILVPVQGTNVSLWSLANEFWYYLAFPLAACALFPQFSKAIRVISFVVACGVLWFVGPAIALLFPIWLMGALVSVAPAKLGKSTARVFSWMALGALLLSIGGVRLLDMEAVKAEYVIGVFTSLLLYGIIAQNWTWQEVSRNGAASTASYRGVARFFSNISYSLYLFHLPLAVFLCGLVDSPWRSLGRGPKTLAWFGCSDLLILGLVYLLWWAFESRTDALRSKLFRAEARAA